MSGSGEGKNRGGVDVRMLMRSRAMIRVRLKKRDKVWIRASTRARAQEVLAGRPQVPV